MKLLLFTIRGFKLHYWAEAMIRPEEQTTLYAFWMSYDGFAAALCKHRHPEMHAVARGHGGRAMSRYLLPRLQSLAPYVPGEQPQDRRYVKLNTNESPFPPSPRVLAVLNRENISCLNLYPDPLYQTLRQAIADEYGLAPQNVFVGNGSDEVLGFAFMRPGAQRQCDQHGDPRGSSHSRFLRAHNQLLLRLIYHAGKPLSTRVVSSSSHCPGNSDKTLPSML